MTTILVKMEENQFSSSSSSYLQPYRNNSSTNLINNIESEIQIDQNQDPTLQKRLALKEIKRAQERLQNAAFRGAMLGVVLRGGLALSGQILRQVKGKNKKQSNQKWQNIIRETIQYGLFLGTMGGGYVAIDETLKSIIGEEDSAKWRAFVGGLCIGPSLLLLGQVEVPTRQLSNLHPTQGVNTCHSHRKPTPQPHPSLAAKFYPLATWRHRTNVSIMQPNILRVRYGAQQLTAGVLYVHPRAARRGEIMT
eukprot:TRINITY_DN24280_c0_g1_i3.p2 TRINITY_DN24280_c0_g1~~TRINITY_DN24280_c0_g1_i3.p2  ORF type:complete len:251 (-),score=20.97 TRINITY_DN24280_c0_g1_i3:7-759(-)